MADKTKLKNLSGRIKKKYHKFKQDKKEKKKNRERERHKIRSLRKPIDYWQFNKLSFSDKKNYIKEWFCKCKHCGEKWHYLDDVEKKMKSQKEVNSCLQEGELCCNPRPCTTWSITTNASTQLKKQLNELRQCPKCKSSNVTCEAKYFKKE